MARGLGYLFNINNNFLILGGKPMYTLTYKTNIIYVVYARNERSNSPQNHLN